MIKYFSKNYLQKKGAIFLFKSFLSGLIIKFDTIFGLSHKAFINLGI